MGCDIHLYAERKWSDRGPWVFVMEHDANRYYRLFGRLAGVRDESQKVIVPPRGLPDDLSPEVEAAAEKWDMDAHNRSWLTLDEAEQARGIAPDFDALLDYLTATTRDYESVRLVFWFDN